MFNLPFPTDSLYKFSFMFGLVLIVFSFYFKNNQLNRFDKRQIIFKIDSLKKLEAKIISHRAEDSLKIHESIDGLHEINVRKLPNTAYIKSYLVYLPNYKFNIADTATVNIYKFLINCPNSNSFVSHNSVLYNNYCRDLLTALRLYNEKVETELEYYDAQLGRNHLYYWSLLLVGILLFIPGLFLWYFKIQRIQDELLKMQLIEAKKNVKI